MWSEQSMDQQRWGKIPQVPDNGIECGIYTVSAFDCASRFLQCPCMTLGWNVCANKDLYATDPTCTELQGTCKLYSPMDLFVIIDCHISLFERRVKWVSNEHRRTEILKLTGRSFGEIRYYYFMFSSNNFRNTWNILSKWLSTCLVLLEF